MSDTGGRRRHKRLIIDEVKLSKARKLLGAKTGAEAVERALDPVIDEHERNRRARAAHDRFLRAAVRGSLRIHDAFGRLDAE